MAQADTEEKEGNDGKVVNQFTDEREFQCNVIVNITEQNLKLEVQNKKSFQLFGNIFSRSQLQQSGFSPQQSLADIKNMLELAFGKEENLTLKIS